MHAEALEKLDYGWEDDEPACDDPDDEIPTATGGNSAGTGGNCAGAGTITRSSGPGTAAAAENCCKRYGRRRRGRRDQEDDVPGALPRDAQGMPPSFYEHPHSKG